MFKPLLHFFHCLSSVDSLSGDAHCSAATPFLSFITLINHVPSETVGLAASCSRYHKELSTVYIQSRKLPLH